MSQAPRHRSHSPGVPALDWLGKHPQGVRLLQTAHELLALQSALGAALPPALMRHLRVARLDGQQITVMVPGPAYAARLRQMTGQAARQLRQAGWPVDAIVVRIDASMGRGGTRKPLRETQPLDEQALRSFEALQGQLSPSPLSEAVARLLRHHRG
ncbi:MAG TPA: DciA family protein [Castellaniella sp.]|nr:DciA family protein [Castellaniella sp.]